MNRLDSLRRHSVIVADSGDIEAVRTHSPRDCTTNPTLILKAAQMPAYRPFVEEAMDAAAREGGDAAQRVESTLDHLAVIFGSELTRIVPGDVSTEVDARLSFDTEATVAKGERLAELYTARGIDTGRILIKVAATWEGIRAAEALEHKGLRCNVTLVFSLAQAVASAEAGAFLISPFVGRILDWHVKSAGRSFSIDEDPGVQSVRRIHEQFKRRGYPTVVMGASFRSREQVEALAGCDRLTVSPALLGELASLDGDVERALFDSAREDDTHSVLDEAAFRWDLNEDQMATEKLSEGIRQFNADSMKLRAYVAKDMAVALPG